MAEVNPAIIKRTQELLGKVVKKPPLTEKLLKKPPFRFIHDVINAVIRDTGFLKGLYKPEELVSDNVKERDAKIAFLQKLIDVTSIATNKSIAAKPSKIVAGQEPERTNELLQLIGMAIQNKVDSKKAIEEWKNKQGNQKGAAAAVGNKKGSTIKTTTTSKVNNAKKSPSVSTTTTLAAPSPAIIEKTSDDLELEKKSRVDSGIVEDGNPATEEAPINGDSIEKRTAENSLPNSIPADVATPLVGEVETEKEVPVMKNSAVEPVEPESMKTEISPPKVVDEKQELIKAIDEEADRRKKEVKKAPPSRKSSSDNLLNKEQSLETAAATSSPKAPPPAETIKVNSGTKKESRKAAKVENTPSATATETVEKRAIRPRTSLRPPSVRPASARPGAPRKRNVEVVIQPDENVQLGDINVKVEQFKSSLKDDDDDDNLIVIENIQDSLLKDTQPETQTHLPADDNQGQLVKQILESQKEFESNDGVAKSDQGRNNTVTELRDHIQKLTKSIQPLGKFMDFLMEDIDSMQREYEMWRERGKEVSVKLAREKNTTENTVQSLKHQLEELNDELEEKRSAVVTMRENILQNEERILKLFKSF